MAKRAPSDELPYNPIDQALVNAAVNAVAVEDAPAPPVPPRGLSLAEAPAMGVVRATPSPSKPQGQQSVRSPQWAQETPAIGAPPQKVEAAASLGDFNASAEANRVENRPSEFPEAVGRGRVVSFRDEPSESQVVPDGRSRVPLGDPNERFQDRRIPLSPTEDADLERLVTNFGSELGAKVKGTHVGRALFNIFTDAHDQVLARARKAPRLRRPGNGDPIGLQKFEQHVRDIVEAGLRDYLMRGRGTR